MIKRFKQFPQRLQYSLAVILLALFAMGVSLLISPGWLNVPAWYFWLPLACIVGVIAILDQLSGGLSLFSTDKTVSLDESLDRYLDWVEVTYGRLDLRGVEERPGLPKMTLADVYVSLKATLNAADESGNVGRRSTESSVDMSELLQQSRHVAIVGGPGCGKTTYLKIIASALAHAIRSKDDSDVHQHLGLTAPLPVPIFISLGEYNRYRHTFSDHENPDYGTVRGFISRHVRSKVRNLPHDFFDKLLDSDKPVIALLDGLDEVADDTERRLVSQELQAFIDNREAAYIVVTSRTRAYRGYVQLKDLQVAEVQPMEPQQVSQLVSRWCDAAYAGEDDRKRESELLQAAIESLEEQRKVRKEPPLVDTPLMVTVVAIVYRSEHQLPKQRAALYAKCVDVLIAEKHHAVTKASENLRVRGGTVDAKKRFLAFLAFKMMSAGEEAGRTIDDRQLHEWLQPEFEREYGRENAKARLREFVEAMHSRGSLVKEVDRRYSFVHLAFQEFLAAYYLAETVREPGEIVSVIIKHERATQSWWREAFLLTIGFLGLRDKEASLSLISKLSQVVGSDELELSSVELAATAFVELESKDETVKLPIYNRLVQLLSGHGLDLQPASRLLAGDALARMGDNRKGVGTVEKNGMTIPDIAWGKLVPAGTYTIGDDQSKYEDKKPREAVISQPFQLAVYPVTYAQFHCFQDAEDFSNPRWWRGMPEDERIEYLKSFSIVNRPYEWVSWYQAIAFCGWLSDKLGIEVDLPHEYEWEVAARYPDSYLYPWGNEFDATKANTTEAGLDQTTAVGIFPDGVNAELGLYDMSGNVNEWCRNKHNNPNDAGVDQSGDSRAMRGGGFSVEHVVADGICRWFAPPANRDPIVGFRCVVRHPPFQ